MSGWIDIHAHLNFLENPPEESLSRAKAAGVARVITIGTETADHPLVLGMVQTFPGEVFGTLGFHPHEASQYSDDEESRLRRELPTAGIVAVGEIGLDFYYEHSPREVQIEVFRRQMQIAADLGLPVEIHTRDAEPETVEVLREFKGRVSGVIHCFSGSAELATSCLDLGYNLSISGIVTFKKAAELRDIVSSTPVERLHVETDAPFLAPVPHRGKKNEPALLIHTAECIAELKGMTVESLQSATNANAARVFPRLATHSN